MPRKKETSDWKRLQQALGGKSWQYVLTTFLDALAAAGVRLGDLPVHRRFAADDAFDEVKWFAWWTRDRVDALPSELAQKYRDKRFTQVALHDGGQPRVGELGTVTLLAEAEPRGPKAVGSVLLLALLGSPDLARDFKSTPAFPVQLVKAQLYRWAHDQLREFGIDAYWQPNTTNRLPPDMFPDEEVDSLESYLSAMAKRVGEILQSRVPVVLTLYPSECPA